MSAAEGPCYTIINSPDSEPFNEMQLKQDLGLLIRIIIEKVFHLITYPPFLQKKGIKIYELKH